MKTKLSVFFFTMFVIGTDTFIVSPLLPTLRKVYQISVESSGWIVSAYALGYALFALVTGPVSDGLNRKTVMIAGMTSFAVFSFLCGFASHYWLMILLRFLSGVSAAITSPQIWAAIPQLVPKNKILKAMGIATAGLAVSQMLGVPTGSYLAAFGWPIPFIVIGVSSFLLVILIAFVLPSMPAVHSQQKSSSIYQRYRTLLSERGAKVAFLAYFIFQSGNFAAFSFIGTWLSDQFDLSVARIGTVILFIGLGNTLSSFFSSGLVQKIGIKTSFISGMLLVILLYMSLPFLPNLYAVRATYFLIFFLLGMLFPIMMSVLQSLSVTVRGTISSLANSSMYFGTTIGSSFAGVLYAGAGGFRGVCVLTVLCFILSFGLFLKSGILPEPKRSELKKETV
ncbi:MFS transporter [Sporolactobacillus sp. THM7-4]|nr:MFS transporter [Sporolactobacillus sp. THM7-4]